MASAASGLCTPGQLEAMLAECCEPELALRQFEVLLRQHPAETRRRLAAPEALRGCLLLLGASQWLGQTLLQNPDLLPLCARPALLTAARTAEEYAEQFARARMRMHALPLPELLTRFKRREYVRIFLRELLGLASLPETTAEISTLAEALIAQALEHCEGELRRHAGGWPQRHSRQGRVAPARFAVMALGKLGGNELNYSSDIDLLFIYDDGEDARSISMPARQFFTQLAQQLTALLCHVGGEGQLFRVDLRLRPQGSSGEIAVGLAQALRYYRAEAQDWELQALLKLRCAAGDRALAREFVEQVQPLVYAPGLSLSAIQTAARSLERIRRGAAPATDGAVDVKNSTGGIREIEFLTQCLQRVHGGSEPWLHSSGTLAALQKLHDKGHIGSAEWHELAECYRLLRAVEHRLQCRHGLQTHRLPAEVGEQEALLRSLGEATLSTPAALAGRMRRAAELCGSVLRLGSHQGVAPAGPVQLSSRGLQKLSAELAAASPALASALSARAPGNLERFLAGAATSEERLAGALANAALIERALPVLAASQLATEILARHPEDLGALFAGEPGCPEPATVEQLRIGSRRLALRTIGRTFVEPLTVFELLAAHTRGMEECVRRALESLAAPAGFAVLAVGRIGTCEADILSDADLLFVRSQGCDPEAAQRCAHELVTALSAYTREGAVLTVDTRIRPHGNAGELVSTIRQLESYFAGEAKGWELLAFSKLRWLAGDGQVAADAVASVGGLRDRCRASREFAAELLGVRRRLEESVPGESFKTGPGGLYDLDFLLGFLEARAGCSSAGRQQPERLASLVEEGLLTAGQGSRLIEIVQLFRRTDHALRVTEGRARHWLPAAEQLRGQVEALVGRPRLEDELRQAMAGTRSIFSAVFND